MPTERSTRASKRGKPASDTFEISTFPNAIRYLYDRGDVERQRAVSLDRKTFQLERMEQLLAKLGDPHRDLRFIHIAGTVGKGSTVAMISSMLRAAGYAVGEFTSPHLVDVRERVRINGQLITRNDFVEHVRTLAQVSKELSFDPTFFELLTALSLVHFAEQAVDIAIMEVGLGGRLDCTNVITPEVVVVTSIDYDHTHLLGRTHAEIAREKAGIFKSGVPAFTIEQPEEAAAVLRTLAEETGALLKVINQDIEFSYRFGASADRGPHAQVSLFTPTSRFEHVPVPLPGEHQAHNCALALAAVDHLKSMGYRLEDMDLHTGLASTDVPGRMELVWQQPKILVDGAHNPAAIQALMKSIGSHVPYDSLVCIFGCCEDKDVNTMLDRLALGGDKVIFTRATGIARAADPEDLQRIYTERSGKFGQVAKNIAEALDIAKRAVGRDDLICVTGSFYLVGETKKFLADVARKRAAQSATA